MKKSLFFAILLSALLSLSVFAAEDVVFIQNDSVTYATLAAAADALPATGGTIVVNAAVVHGDASADAVTMPAKPVTVTSVWDGVDYAKTNGAYFGVGRTLQLKADTVFENIEIRQTNTTTTYGNIYANGFHLTVGEGVTTVSNATSGRMTNIYGGSSNGAFTTAKTHVTIQSGTWDLVFGGSYQTLKGDSQVDITGGSIGSVYGGSRDYHTEGDTVVNVSGGTIRETVAGGNYQSGNITRFIGSTTLNITGGTVEYNSAGFGVVGGSVGKSGGKACTFSGDITVNIGGNATVNNTIHGTSRYTNVTTTANVTVNIGGNATIGRHVYAGGYGNVTAENGIVLNLKENARFVNPTGSSGYICAGANSSTVTGDVTVNISDNVSVAGNVYAGGYSGNVTGNATVNMYGGTVNTTVSPGSRSGAVSGNATVNALGGKIGYHEGGTYGVTLRGASTSATVGGTFTVLLDGADIAGAINTSTENSVVTLKSGKVGTVAQKAAIDLTGGKALTVGGDVTVSTLTGGGALTLPAAASLTADSFAGEVALSIEGAPTPFKPYVTVNDVATEGVVAYTTTDDGLIVKKVGESAVTYAITYPGMYETTKVTVTYYNPDADGEQPDIVVYKGASSSSSKVKIADLKDGATYEADLAPGLYYWKVYYNGGTDYRLKHFLIEGDRETLSFDVPFEPYTENSYMENVTAETTDQVLEAFFSMDDFVGFGGFDTPTFTEKYANTRKFMTNEDLCAYVTALDEDCGYLYAFLAELHDQTNLFPVLVFTKDEIPAGATLEEIASIVRAGGTREIISVTGGIHGNEPAGEEGVLNFGKQLCGEYGEKLFANEHIGAVVLMPATSPDNLMRFKRTYTDGENPNRDTTSMRHGNTQMVAYVYDLFMPTVHFDCHEDTSGTNTIDASDNSYSNIDDVVFTSSSLPNSPVQDIRGVLNGDIKFLEQDMYALTADMIERTAESGLRTGYYQWTYFGPGQIQAHAIMRGSYGYLIEVMRIWTGKSHYERAVFAMMTALMNAVEVVADENGAIAEKVTAVRAAAAVESFDESNPFVLKMASGKSDVRLTYKHPSVYADGTYKDADATVTRTRYDMPTATRPMATGYVLDADASDIEGVKEKLDQAGLDYVMLPAGTTLTLRKYTSISDSAAYGEAEEVTFANGALAVHTNTSDAYYMAYYFEPDSYLSEDTIVSLYQNGLITSTDALYRSEENGFAAKLAALTAPEPAPEYDFNGDGKENVADVLALVRGILNENAPAAGDLSGDGKVTLLDVVRLLKKLSA